MTNNTRGILMALAAIGAFIGVTQITLHPLRPPPGPAPLVQRPEEKKFVYGEQPQICAALASQYARQWEVSTACSDDDECVAERSTPDWWGTDECFRFGNKSVKNDPAAKTGQLWHLHGCLDPQLASHQACPITPEVQCRRGRCLARSSTANGWKRVALPEVARILVPADFEAATADDKRKLTSQFYRQLEGKGRTLTVLTTREGPAAAAPSPTDKALKLVAQQAVRVDGYPTTLFVVEDRLAVAKPGGAPARHFRATTELAIAALQGQRLVFEMTCETRGQCDPLSVIVDQADLFVSGLGQKQD